jgi:hypothetical protein
MIYHDLQPALQNCSAHRCCGDSTQHWNLHVKVQQNLQLHCRELQPGSCKEGTGHKGTGHKAPKNKELAGVAKNWVSLSKATIHPGIQCSTQSRFGQ